MNITDLSYIIEVANTGSISKAAQNLYLSQPNISFAIQKLEKEIGFKIFVRTPQGMELTENGSKFVIEAEKIYNEYAGFEKKYHGEIVDDSFNVGIAYPRSTYISEAITDFLRECNSLEQSEIKVFEIGSMSSVYYVYTNKVNLGIIRFHVEEEIYYKSLFKQYNLNYEEIASYYPKIMFSETHPLANNEYVTIKDLENYTEISYEDTELPIFFKARTKDNYHKKSIKISDRATQIRLLQNVPGTYLYVAPVPKKSLNRFHLVIRSLETEERARLYKDVLIYRKNYTLDENDKKLMQFISENFKDSIL